MPSSSFILSGIRNTGSPKANINMLQATTRYLPSHTIIPKYRWLHTQRMRLNLYEDVFCLCISIPLFSIRAGTKNSATSRDTTRLMMTTAAKSCSSILILSSRKKTIPSAPTVVNVAASIARKAFRLWRCLMWSAITMMLSITRFSEIVMPAKE